MGGNGSKMRGNLDNSATREFKEVFFISNNIKVVQLKDNKKRVRLPEESNTPNRIYVIFNKDGTLKSIGKYGSDCLKNLRYTLTINTTDYNPTTTSGLIKEKMQEVQ